MQGSKEKKIGVLLVNLGTPASPKPFHVFRYLNEFLTDYRVIDLPWFKRQLLVRGAIVPLRYRQSAEQYKQVWTEKGSPLLLHGISIKDKLQESLGKSFSIELAMRYQEPSIPEKLNTFQENQVDHLIILPLFPQYASATTGSVQQKVMETLSSWLVIPKLTFIDHFFDHPGYINAFCERVREHPYKTFDQIVFSFHGLPERHIRQADRIGQCLKTNCCSKMNNENRFCYKAQCSETARLIASQLELSEKEYTVCFQSRLGKDPWLEPYTQDVLHDCLAEGKKRVLVLSPAFVCDCLETTFEIDQEYRKEFMQGGGDHFQMVKGLNDHPSWVEALQSIILGQI